VLAGGWATIRLHGKFRVARLVKLCLAAGVDRAVLSRNPEIAFVLAEELNGEQKFDEIIAILTPHLQDNPALAKLYGARAMGYLGLGKYEEALADLDRCVELRPGFARDFSYHRNRAFLLGRRGDQESARKAMAEQMIGPGYQGTAADVLAAHLAKKVRPYLAPLKLKGSIGVAIGAFNTTVGHAILDPFHFIQLFGFQFDHLVLVHPPYSEYSPATRLSAAILSQYVEQVETTDLDTLNFAWHNLGELRHENLTFLVHHYWSLNRLAFQARTDPNHPMSHGREYLSLPPKMANQAGKVCRRGGIDPGRPLVVVHIREHGYHKLHGQRYRNIKVQNYIPALRWLIKRGYQIFRIGDQKMTSIRREVPELVELPTWHSYDPMLDPYLISRCRFMISCQSGPCSYARVFGKPNLVVNAVYHYTLLPERNELLAFKSYWDARTNEPMTLDAIFRAGAHLFDRTEHFDDAGIRVEDMTPEEILAATEEMVNWLDHSDQPESASQHQFRAKMEWYARHMDRSHPLAHPMTDYIGYALPECRISDAVCQLRPGFLPELSEAPPSVRGLVVEAA
jgi:putative glycosyltransferase (TIGR04372 family)